MQDEESSMSGEAACQQVESVLQVSEQRFRQLADSMPHIVFAARPDGSMEVVKLYWWKPKQPCRELGSR